MARLDEKPMLVTGPSGSGKSSLIANFVHSRRRVHPRNIVFEHYIGASPESANSVQMVRRLLAELKRVVGNDDDAYSDDRTISRKVEWRRLQHEVKHYDHDQRSGSDEQRLIFAEFLFRLAQLNAYAETSGINVLISIDGLDKFVEPHFKVGDLWWIPGRLPPRVKLLISCVDKGGHDGLLDLMVVRRDEFEKITVNGIDKNDRRVFITRTLSAWGKKLSETRIKPVLKHRLSGMPMFLKLVLEELRLSGVEGHLDERLEFYLQARDMPGLYSNIMQRLEGECGAAAMKSALSVIWASRAGLEEAEIFAIAKISPLSWATLRTVLGPAFGDQLGRMTLADRFLRDAVTRRYVPEEKDQRAAHLALATYFRAQPVNDRKAEELPFQLRAARDWAGLATVLADPELFVRCIARGYFEMGRYWNDVNQHGLDPFENLTTALRQRSAVAPAEAGVLAREIGYFFGNFGLHDYSMWLQGDRWRGV